MPKQTKEKKKKSGTTKKIINWKEYNEALVNRGKIIFQITEDAIKQWEEVQRDEKKKRGCPKKFSDTAIETFLSLQQFFQLPLRSTEGLLSNILSKLHTDRKSPDYSTVSIRSKDLKVNFKVRPEKENIHFIVDSTGIKVFGEGEWKVRKHGYSKRRTWRKLHLGIDESTGDILAIEVTDNDVDDGAMLAPLLDQVDEKTKIDQFSGDGAYDMKKCYDALTERGVNKVTIPPRKNAKIWRHGNSKEERLIRDENVRDIRKIGRKKWKQENGYHRRSLSETAMFRFKTIFGNKVSARLSENQTVQLLVRGKLLNMMTALGMPRYDAGEVAA